MQLDWIERRPPKPKVGGSNPLMFAIFQNAIVAELAVAPGSGPGWGNSVGVRIPPMAPLHYHNKGDNANDNGRSHKGQWRDKEGAV